MEFKIEDIGLPENIKERKKYPFKSMGINQSFYVEGPDWPARHKIRSAASWAGHRNGMKFSCRIEGDGIRVYRIK